VSPKVFNPTVPGVWQCLGGESYEEHYLRNDSSLPDVFVTQHQSAQRKHNRRKHITK